MKMFKSLIIAIVGILLCAFSLCGCNSSTTKNADIPRDIVGTFKYTGKTYALIRSFAPYKYAIYETDGDFFAYVDTSKMIAARLDFYFDKLVVIRGNLVKVDGEKVLMADSIRLK